MKALVLYDSMSGNTKQVATTIHNALDNDKIQTDIIKAHKNTDLNFYDYDLIFIGSPVIDWLPTQPMMNLIKKKLKGYNSEGLIKPSSPIVPGKFAVCFGTFAGPHIGKKEAIPMTMWLRSFLEHLGFIVLDLWHIPGKFKNRDDLNTNGRLGNIQHRPDRNDLAIVENRVHGVIGSLEAWLT